MCSCLASGFCLKDIRDAHVLDHTAVQTATCCAKEHAGLRAHILCITCCSQCQPYSRWTTHICNPPLTSSCMLCCFLQAFNNRRRALHIRPGPPVLRQHVQCQQTHRAVLHLSPSALTRPSHPLLSPTPSPAPLTPICFLQAFRAGRRPLHVRPGPIILRKHLHRQQAKQLRLCQSSRSSSSRTPPRRSRRCRRHCCHCCRLRPSHRLPQPYQHSRFECTRDRTGFYQGCIRLP